MQRANTAAADADCLRTVANALTCDQRLIAFLRDLAPQWGSSTGKTRSFGCTSPSFDACGPCILRVDSRAAIILNEALYSPRGPSKVASHLADALRRAQVDETGTRCRICTDDLAPILLGIEQYSDAEGNAVAADSPAFHHRVVSIVAG
jgi:hypothetical protein